VNRLRRKELFCCGLAAIAASLFALDCTAAEPRPPGVSWRVVFSVQPVYPKSFEISAGGPRSLGTEELKEAWRKKAVLVANGHKFKTSPLVVHDNESIAYGTYLPVRNRSVTGTITLTN
jgi:hypothetical protein